MVSLPELVSQEQQGLLMATEELTIRYPAGFERAVHLTKAEMEQHLRLMAALKMSRKYHQNSALTGKSRSTSRGRSIREQRPVRQVVRALTTAT